MNKILSILFILFFISGCNNETIVSSETVPEIMQPNWEEIETEDMPVKIGDIIEFDNDSILIKAIVLDFSQDEAGKWIGICFINQNRLFGRQIPNGMTNNTCLDLLDFTYIQKEYFTNYKVIENIKVNKYKIGIGAKGTASSFSDIKREFNWGIEQRKKQQTPCNKELFSQNPIRECYFDLEKITKQSE